MKFAELARTLWQPQLSEIWRSFSDREEAIVEDCASRGWPCLCGSDYAKINNLGRTVLKEMSERIWNSLIESYEASENKPTEKELRNFYENEINQNASSISETIIARIIQQNINQKLPDLEGQKEWARREIDTESDHLIKLLSGQLNVFLGKMSQQPDSPLILKPTFFGVGIDLIKVGSWFKWFRRSTK